MSKSFWGGLALGVVLTTGASLYLVKKVTEEPVRFGRKLYLEIGNTVHFEGSIYADGGGDDAPINNFISGDCYQDRMECEIHSVNEIAAGHISPIVTDTITVRSWNEREIIADSQAEHALCNWFEIKIDRRAQEILYTRFPNPKANQEFCRSFLPMPRVLKWRIDNGAAWDTNADGKQRSKTGTAIKDI